MPDTSHYQELYWPIIFRRDPSRGAQVHIQIVVEYNCSQNTDMLIAVVVNTLGL
jgi:hypothetical protein